MGLAPQWRRMVGLIVAAGVLVRNFAAFFAEFAEECAGPVEG